MKHRSTHSRSRSHNTGSRSGGAKRMLVATLTIGTALALTVPSAAQAEAIVSQGTGRLVTTSLLSSAVLDSLVALKGASAVNTTGTADVVANTPLDVAAVSGLVGLKVGATTLPVFGNSGVIRLGAVGQYSRANSDGSSTAFSGTVAAAPALIGVNSGAVTPSSPIGTPTAGSEATVVVGNRVLDPVSIQAELTALAASAAAPVAGAQTGQYRLGSFGVIVGGRLVATPVSTISPAIDGLIVALQTAGVATTANPFPADFTMTLRTSDLQAAGLGGDLNALPTDTDLTAFIPQALTSRITMAANDYLATATAALLTVPVGMRPALQLAITTAHGVIDPLVANLGSSFQGPVGIALRALVQLVVNHQQVVNGSFTETALRVGLGTNGALATVDLASAAVGPNAVPVVAPTPGATTGTAGAGAGTTGGSGTGNAGGSGNGAVLAHTGSPLEAELLPWSVFAFALLGAGFAIASVMAKGRRRSQTE